MVGGFYTYDSRTETKDLGTVCTGTSDAPVEDPPAPANRSVTVMSLVVNMMAPL